MKVTGNVVTPRQDVPRQQFREVFGNFCTGVAVITASTGGGPVGFSCQALTVVSTDPPLMLFCPTKTLGCWPPIARSGRFGVHVLAAEQGRLARLFGTPGADKFGSVDWAPSPSGTPVLAGVLSWAECEVQAVHDGGDHHIVVGRVVELGDSRSGEPLLYHRGRLAAAPFLRPAEMATI
jgi:3-hydroxy-9,10-secoandrosta-1,3,5(10)-triene-9,17-dione monooxygenase reductase component